MIFSSDKLNGMSLPLINRSNILHCVFKQCQIYSFYQWIRITLTIESYVMGCGVSAANWRLFNVAVYKVD